MMRIADNVDILARQDIKPRIEPRFRTAPESQSPKNAQASRFVAVLRTSRRNRKPDRPAVPLAQSKV